ncbi:hypothetical protein TcasGA2_TC008011 [Tribolium castaneum]|uniref:Uncharacterized protein n=1 Tax=Tribolium castaneum TaxID=7070 RepID=D1ZZA8_TRICA|nr:hypothetical protein TcasGA2_TC008011 [Tribolium castaneum]
MSAPSRRHLPHRQSPSRLVAPPYLLFPTILDRLRVQIGDPQEAVVAPADVARRRRDRAHGAGRIGTVRPHQRLGVACGHLLHFGHEQALHERLGARRRVRRHRNGITVRRHLRRVSSDLRTVYPELKNEEKNGSEEYDSDPFSTFGSFSTRGHCRGGWFQTTVTWIRTDRTDFHRTFDTDTGRQLMLMD